MPFGAMEIAGSVVAAVLLGMLWVGEAVCPLFGRRDRREALKVRAQNLSLGLLNALFAAGFAVLTFGVASWCAVHEVGLFWVVRGWAGGGSLLMEAGLLVVALVALDLWQYVFHVLAHKSPLLWRFHVVHHNDSLVQATTALRFHTGEIVVQHLLSLGVYALLGVSVIHVLTYQLIVVPVALFHHANVRLPERIDAALRWLIVTPRMHIVHHSKWEPETDSNFSAVLSVWDHLFRTYRWRDDPTTIEVGLDGYSDEDILTLRGMLLAPREPAHAEYGPAPAPGLVPRELRWRDRRRRA